MAQLGDPVSKEYILGIFRKDPRLLGDAFPLAVEIVGRLIKANSELRQEFILIAQIMDNSPDLDARYVAALKLGNLGLRQAMQPLARHLELFPEQENEIFTALSEIDKYSRKQLLNHRQTVGDEHQFLRDLLVLFKKIKKHRDKISLGQKALQLGP